MQPFDTSQGGTGTNVPPTAGQFLVGQSDGTYLPATITPTSPTLEQVLTAGNDGGGLNMENIGAIYDSTGSFALADFSGTPNFARPISFDTTYGVTNIESQLSVGGPTDYYGYGVVIPLSVKFDYNSYGGMFMQNKSSGNSAATNLTIGADNDIISFTGHYVTIGVLGSGWVSNNAGIVQTVSIANGGTSYTIGDVITVSGGDDDLQLTVTSVGGSGDITGVTITFSGIAYTISSGNPTTGGTGTGCTINITSLYNTDGANANDGFVYASGGDMAIGTDGGTAGKVIKFFTGGLGTGNIRMIISDSGIQMLGNLFDTANTLVLNFDARSLWSTLGNPMLDWSQSAGQGLGMQNGISSYSFGGFPVVINTEAAQLNDSFGILSEDWNLRQLIGPDGTSAVVDWQNYILQVDGNQTSINWGGMQLIQIAGNVILDWNAGELYQVNGAGGITMLNWADSTVGLQFLSLASDPISPVESSFYYNTTIHDYKFWDGTTWQPFTTSANNLWTKSGGIVSLTTGTDHVEIQTGIYDAGNLLSADFNARKLYSLDGIQAVVDWGMFQILDGLGFLSLAWFSRVGADTTGTQSYNWDQRSLIWTDGTTIIFDWASGIFNDEFASKSVDIFNRQLVDGLGTNILVDWIGGGNPAASISFNNIGPTPPSVIFGSIIQDTSDVDSINPNGRQLNNSAGPATLDWDNQLLIDVGTSVIDWSRTINTSAALSFSGSNAIFTATIDDTSEISSIDTNGRIAFDTFGNQSIAYGSRLISSTSQNTLIDYSGTITPNAGISFFDNGITSIYNVVFGFPIQDTSSVIFGVNTVDTNNRLLYASDGTTVILDWTNLVNGLAAISFDSGQFVVLATGIESNLDLAPSIDTNNRQLWASTAGNFPILDWQTALVTDLINLLSINWDARILYANDGSTVMFNWDDPSVGYYGLIASSAPASPVEGAEYYDNTLHEKGYYNGTSWVYPTAGGGGGPWTRTGSVVNLTTGTDTVEIQTSIHETAAHLKAADFNSKQLFSTNGITSSLTVDWGSSTLNVGSIPVVEWANHQLLDNSGNDMVFWGNIPSGVGVVFPNLVGSNTFHKPVIDTENAILLDGTSLATPVSSLDWALRIMYDQSGTQVFTWDTSVNNFPEFSTSIFFSSGSAILDLALAPSIDPNGRVLIDANSLTSIDYENRNIYDISGTIKSIDYDNRVLYRNLTGTQSISIDYEQQQMWTTTLLGAGGLGKSIDYSARTLLFQDVTATTIMIDWSPVINSSAAISFDGSQNVAFKESIVDISGLLSITPNNRTLYDSTGTAYFNWDVISNGGAILVSAPIDMDTSNNIINLADGVNPQDAVTVSQLTSKLPARVDFVAATGQSSDITTTAFAGTSVSGLYRISYYLLDSAADLTAGAVTLNVTYTDDSGAQTISSTPVVLTTLGSKTQGDMIVETASGSVSYSVTHTGIFGTATYNVYLTAEKLA